MSNEHWSQAFFKQEIFSISPLNGGRQHQIDLVKLVDQSKWVCKKFCAQTWLGATNELNLKFTETLAARVASELGITFAAYKPKKSS